MKAKHQRLALVGVALAAILGASALAMSAIGEKANYFYAPGDLARAQVPDGKAIRLGGMVTPGSVKRGPDGVTLNFIVHDDLRSTPVVFRGLPPDLFREGSGVVAEGAMQDGTFVATNLLAKHDERYVPPSATDSEHKSVTLVQ